MGLHGASLNGQGVEDVARVGLPAHAPSLTVVLTESVSASPGSTVLSDSLSLGKGLSAIQQLLGGSCYYY